MSVSALLRTIVPVKPAYGGKSRLAGVLDSEGRAALCLLLLQHVLRVVSRAATATETCVVGGDEWVQRVASEESALWQAEPGGGLNEAIRHATSTAFEAGAPAILVLPGDLGLLQPEDVDGLVALSGGMTRAVLARAAADGGTNAVLAPRGFMIDPSFGPDSFSRHLEAAQRANVPVEVSLAPGLSFDLDTPEDMSVYREQQPDLDEALESWRRRLRSQISAGKS